jgi:hypothetical protein
MRRFAGLTLAVLLGAAGLVAVPMATPAGADTVLTSCDEAAFRAAVAAGGTVTWSDPCTVVLTAPVEIPAGLTVTIDGGAVNRVVLSGGSAHRHFEVTGGTVNLARVVLTAGSARGATGGAGNSGSAGAEGVSGSIGETPDSVFCPTANANKAAPGDPGTPGRPATPGSAGEAGTSGGEASAASILISSGAASLDTVRITGTSARAGDGGNGGAGGTGGRGGNGGAGGGGQQGLVDQLTARKCVGGGDGGNGGDGGDGGAAGTGGPGGSGGSIRGGLIVNGGTLRLTDTQFSGITVTAGNGGDGGTGGAGGASGEGGSGGDGGSGHTGEGGDGGDGGDGGGAGKGGRGGDGGAAGTGGSITGGLLYNEGNATITRMTSSGPSLLSGRGGNGGSGAAGGSSSPGGRAGFGGPGQASSEPRNKNGGGSGTGGPGGPGGAAGSGGNGGAGGGVDGGLVYNAGTLTMEGCFSSLVAAGGAGGGGGLGGVAGEGGAGGPAVVGGTPSTSPGDGLDGANGGAGGSGGSGGDGGPAGAPGDAGAGGDAIGGVIANHGIALVTGGAMTGTARGGAGGLGTPARSGGRGGAGAGGGRGADGGTGNANPQTGQTGGNAGGGGGGGAGGPGGLGAPGGAGGDGGRGGAALGGALANIDPGRLTMTDATVTGTAAGGDGGRGDDGGPGGYGGWGGSGSIGGAGGSGGPGDAGFGDGGDGGSAGHAAPGGAGARGGTGGAGSAGGSARGGGIATFGELNMSSVIITRSTVSGGAGGNGGRGGNGASHTDANGSGLGGTGMPGGPGGGGYSGGSPGGSTTGASGRRNGDGGAGGSAGPGGDARGGGIYTEATTWRLTSVSFTSDTATGGAGRWGGYAGSGGNGGRGGNGGYGGTLGAGEIPRDGVDGAAGGAGGNGASGAAGGAASGGGSAIGGGLFATTMPAIYAGVTYESNALTPGPGWVLGCRADSNSRVDGCGGDAGSGGAGGAGGAGGFGTFPPDPDDPNAHRGANGTDGSPGSNGLPGANGPLGTDGRAMYVDCTPPVCGGPVNGVPVAVADDYTTPQDTVLNVDAAAGVLDNDSDPDGDSLTASVWSSPTAGTLVMNPDGSFAYVSPAGLIGEVSFAYRADDGIASSDPVTVTIMIESAPRAAQTIGFTSSVPSFAHVGGLTYTPTATSTSGLPVTITIDATSAPVCAISGTGEVSFQAPGTCTLNANQPGDEGYLPAAQVQQSFTVARSEQTLGFTTAAPDFAHVGGLTYTPAATSSSGLRVTITVDPASAAVCSISDTGEVSFQGAGTCALNADQAGNADYLPALRVQQSFNVARSEQTVGFTSPAPDSAQVGGPTYTPTATSTSGLPVTIAVVPASAAVCTISTAGEVSYQGAGTCALAANQAGDANYLPAAVVQQSFTVTDVTDAPSFVSPNPPLTATVGQPYSYAFVAGGSPAPTYSLSDGSVLLLAAAAPAWLTIDPSTGVVSGTPPAGTTSFTYSVTATNASGQATAGPFTVTVGPAPPASTRADLSASLSCPSRARLRVNASCTLTVRNAGPATARSVWAAIVLPSSLSRVSATPGATWVRNIAIWRVTSLASGRTTTFSVRFRPVATGRAGVRATTVSASPDPKLRDNVTTASITITR